MPTAPAKRSRDWYSVSLGTIVWLLVLGGGALFFFKGMGPQLWEQFALEKQAQGKIEDAEDLKRQVEQGEGFDPQRSEFVAASEQLRVAQVAFADRHFAEALKLGKSSVLAFEALLQLGQNANGTIRFSNQQGTVEFRRGERGAWKRARLKDRLSPGDWVKTSADGTAEVLFPDGSVYTLRQNTMVHLGDISPERSTGRKQQTADIVFGWVELNTSQSSSTLKTPKSETRVKEESKALVAYDRERESARIAAFQGEVEVKSTSGQTRTLGPLQQLEQKGELLSEPKPLPGRPALLRPIDKQEIAWKTVGERLQLAWSPVGGASRYALRVSSSPLFGRNLIDSRDRQKTSATLGIRDGGNFYWQVAAIDRQGLQGPWSEVGSFRLTAQRTASGITDQTPPELEIYEMQNYGALVLINGKVELGATVTINGEPVSAQADGSFSKTVELKQEGWNFIEVVATDAWGNASRKRQRVFVEGT